MRLLYVIYDQSESIADDPKLKRPDVMIKAIACECYFQQHEVKTIKTKQKFPKEPKGGGAMTRKDKA